MRLYILLLCCFMTFSGFYAVMLNDRIDSRDALLIAQKQKIQNHLPLVVHILVPLCDNEHQGIVPVNKQLGDGLNLKTNLYWGAGYGIKAYFKKLPEWKLLVTQQPGDTSILERVVFNKKLSNGTQVWIVADAYRGDAMKKCLRDFFISLSGRKHDTLDVIN